MRHILLVHYHFLPVHNVSVRRLVGYAKKLSALGWHVHVLTRDWHGVHEADPSWGLSWEPHLEAESHCRILRVPSEPIVESRERASPIARLALGQYPDPFARWVRPAVAVGERLLRQTEIDLVMSYCPPESNHVVGRELSRRLGVPWIPFFGDMYGFLIPDRPTSLRNHFRRAWHRWCLAPAAAAIAVSPAMVDLLGRRYEKPAYLVHTGYDPEDFECLPSESYLGRDHLIVSHVGSVYPGDQRPEVFFDGLDRFLTQHPEAIGRVLVRFIGSKCDVHLKALVRSRPSAKVCEIRPKVDSSMALSMVQSSDALLAFTCTRHRDIYGTLSYPTKVFEAFGARRPVLAVPADRDWVDELLLRTGGGVSARDAYEVAETLARWFRCWVRDGSVPYHGRKEELEIFTRDRQVANLDAIFRSVTENVNGV